MAPDPGVWFALVLTIGVLLSGVLTFGYWLKRRSEAGSRERGTEQWAVEALSLVREVEQVAERFEHRADQDRLRRHLLPLANRIRGHVRAAPRGTDSQLLREFYDLGETCYTLSIDQTKLEALESGVFLEDKLRDLQSDARTVEQTLLTHTSKQS